MRRTTHNAMLIIVTALTLPWPGAALSQTSRCEPLDIRQVALFKNGLGFFIGQVTCPDDRISFQVALPIAPCHGTFWLSYTPVNARNTLRITRAIGVRAEQQELETNRKREAAHIYGRSWDLITVRSDLSIVNFQDKTIDLEITKTLSGEVKNADPEAKRESLAVGLRLMNGLQKLTWSLQLGPGERKTVSYVYDVYVRR